MCIDFELQLTLPAITKVKNSHPLLNRNKSFLNVAQ